MKRKNLVIFLISGLLLGQFIAMSYQYLNLLNPSNGVLWEPIKYANPPKYEKIILPDLSGEVKVIYDKWGVPHIFGNSFEDVFMVFGYVQARDRLFQMDVFRRLIEGRLSEIFGETAFDSDQFHRILGLKYAANLSLIAIKEQYPNVYDYLVAFTKGVNYYIEHGQLPLEFKLLGYSPEPWEPVNSLEVAKYIEWGLTGDFWDIERRVLIEKLGEERVKEIFPMVDYELFPILQANETWYPDKVIPTSAINYKFSTYSILPNDKVSDVEKLLSWLNKVSVFKDMVSFRGSNNWVVSGNLTDTGKPLLANDPHLSLMVPPIWYEAHLVVYNNMNVRGVTFPGIPFIIIGHNDRVAWGVTNVGADVIDYYYYVWLDNETYFYNDSWRKIESREEVIRIKTSGGFIEKVIYVNSTIHGPLIQSGTAKYAMRWIGHMATLEAVAVFKYDTAKNLEEFLDGLRLFNIPGQNLVYADVEGNIMYYPSALYPIRKNLKTGEVVAGNMPFNGSNLDGEWIGFIPFEEIPHALNISRGYIVTANNRPDAGTLPYYWGDSENFADPYRAMRITDMILNAIETKGYVTIEDFKRMHGDSYSIAASKFTPYLLDVLSNAQLNTIESKAKSILENWNYYTFANISAPTIFAMWLYYYRENVFNDDYQLANISSARKPKVSTLQYMTEHPNLFADWFDNKTTEDVIETRDDIILKSFKDAIRDLVDRLGDDPNQWLYGKLHKRKVDHPLGVVLNWLNYPMVSDEGSWFTVDPAPFDPSDKYWYSSLGASWREIIDLSDFENSLCVIPGGQSGNPFSTHYEDQYWLWLKTEYKKMTFPSTPEDINAQDIEGILEFVKG